MSRAVEAELASESNDTFPPHILTVCGRTVHCWTTAGSALSRLTIIESTATITAPRFDGVLDLPCLYRPFGHASYVTTHHRF